MKTPLAQCRKKRDTKKSTVNLNYLSAELNNPPNEIIPGYNSTFFFSGFSTELNLKFETCKVIFSKKTSFFPPTTMAATKFLTVPVRFFYDAFVFLRRF